MTARRATRNKSCMFSALTRKCDPEVAIAKLISPAQKGQANGFMCSFIRCRRSYFLCATSYQTPIHLRVRVSASWGWSSLA